MSYYSNDPNYHHPQGPQRPIPMAPYSESSLPPPTPGYPMPFAPMLGQSQPDYRYQSPTHGMAQGKPKNMVQSLGRVFALNEQVEICIQTDRWVAGFIIGALSLFDKARGYCYKVRYETNKVWKSAEVPPSLVRESHR